MRLSNMLISFLFKVNLRSKALNLMHSRSMNWSLCAKLLNSEDISFFDKIDSKKNKQVFGLNKLVHFLVMRGSHKRTCLCFSDESRNCVLCEGLRYTWSTHSYSAILIGDSMDISARLCKQYKLLAEVNNKRGVYDIVYKNILGEPIISLKGCSDYAISLSVATLQAYIKISNVDSKTHIDYVKELYKDWK